MRGAVVTSCVLILVACCAAEEESSSAPPPPHARHHQPKDKLPPALQSSVKKEHKLEATAEKDHGGKTLLATAMKAQHDRERHTQTSSSAPQPHASRNHTTHGTRRQSKSSSSGGSPLVPAPAPAEAAAPVHVPPSATLIVLGLLVVLGVFCFCFRGSLATMAAGGAESSSRFYSLQVASFTALVTLQTTAILLFKVCQVHGAYTFSPASSIAMTEALKFCIASGLHTRHVKASGGSWTHGIEPRIVLNYAGLSLLYTIVRRVDSNPGLTYLRRRLPSPTGARLLCRDRTITSPSRCTRSPTLARTPSARA